MRVFVTLDDTLYQALQDRALRRGMSFHEVMNDVIARGLANGEPATAEPQRNTRGARPRPRNAGRGSPTEGEAEDKS